MLFTSMLMTVLRAVSPRPVHSPSFLMEELLQNESPSPSKTQRTLWKAVGIAGLIACFTSVENTVLGVSEFAYLAQMDPKATAEFYGAASSVGRFGHAFFALFFSFWVYKTKHIRSPLVFGRFLSFFTCLVYLSIEYFPSSNRRFIMGGCYFFFDIATSAPTILRVYIVVISSKGDRPRAYAALVLANWIAVVIGPVFQLLFSSISYPGVEILPGLRFHIYSAPVWLAFFLNIVSIVLILRFLADLPPNNEKTSFSFLLLVEKILSIPRMSFAWTSIGICWILRVIANLSVVTLMALTTPLLVIVFGYSGEEAVQANSVSSAAVGILALLICSAFMFTSLTDRFPPVFLFGISLLISLSMYLITYPFSVFSHQLVPYNETTTAGCDPVKYSWCDSASAGFPNLFLTMAAIQTGIGLPMAQIALDSIYSRVLGPIDQNILQGAFVCFEDLIYIIGPLYATFVFPLKN